VANFGTKIGAERDYGGEDNFKRVLTTTWCPKIWKAMPCMRAFSLSSVQVTFPRERFSSRVRFWGDSPVKLLRKLGVGRKEEAFRFLMGKINTSTASAGRQPRKKS